MTETSDGSQRNGLTLAAIGDLHVTLVKTDTGSEVLKLASELDAA